MSVGVNFATVVRLGVVKRVGGAKVCELLEEVQGYTPLSGFRDTGYAECVRAGDIADYSIVVGRCDNMAGGYDVVYTDKGGAVSIWYYGEWVGSDHGKTLVPPGGTNSSVGGTNNNTNGIKRKYPPY